MPTVPDMGRWESVEIALAKHGATARFNDRRTQRPIGLPASALLRTRII